MHGRYFRMRRYLDSSVKADVHVLTYVQGLMEGEWSAESDAFRSSQYWPKIRFPILLYSMGKERCTSYLLASLPCLPCMYRKNGLTSRRPAARPALACTKFTFTYRTQREIKAQLIIFLNPRDNGYDTGASNCNLQTAKDN